jgi:hypothetical protein
MTAQDGTSRASIPIATPAESLERVPGIVLILDRKAPRRAFTPFPNRTLKGEDCFRSEG